MATRRKTFKAGKNINSFEPIELQVDDEVFICKPAIQGATLLEFVSRADGDSGGAAAAALYGFFADVMAPEEYERFRAYLNNPELIIDMETIGEMAAWLVEEYSSRPTTGPESLPSGQSTSGPTSTEAPSSAE